MVAFLVSVTSNVVLAGCLAVCVLALTRLWRNPHVAHALWLLVLVKLVTPPLVRIPIDSFTSGESTQPNSAIALELAASDALTSDREYGGAASPSPATASDQTEIARGEHAMNVFWNSIAANWPLWVLAAWSIGTGGFISISLHRHKRLMRLVSSAQAPSEAIVRDAEHIARHIGLAACPRLCMTDAHVSPFVTPSVRSPTIVLPARFVAELNPSQVNSILAHELAHVRRRDHWVRVFDALVLSLYWWNPFAWLASQQLRQSEEESCDTLVVWALPHGRRVYGQTLLKAVEYLTREGKLSAIAGTHFGGCILEKRIEAIMNRMVKHKMSGPGFVVTLVLSVVVLPVAITRAISEDPDTQFLQTAQHEWAEYAKLFDQLQGDLAIESKLVIDGKPTLERGTIRYLKSGDCRSAELTSRVTDPHAPVMSLQLHCLNEDYGFRLSRDSSDDPWKLEQVYLGRDTQPNHMPLWLFREPLESVSPVTLRGRRSLLQLVRDEGFKVEKVTRTDDGLYRVEFAMQTDNAKGQLNANGEYIETESTIQSGHLVLNPRRRWAIESARVVRMTHTEDSYTTELSFSYRSDTEVVPSKVRCSVISDSKNIATGTVDCDVQLELPTSEVAKSRFTLGAFGFAEPVLEAPRE